MLLKQDSYADQGPFPLNWGRGVSLYKKLSREWANRNISLYVLAGGRQKVQIINWKGKKTLYEKGGLGCPKENPFFPL